MWTIEDLGDAIRADFTLVLEVCFQSLDLLLDLVPLAQHLVPQLNLSLQLDLQVLYCLWITLISPTAFQALKLFPDLFSHKQPQSSIPLSFLKRDLGGLLYRHLEDIIRINCLNVEGLALVSRCEIRVACVELTESSFECVQC